MNKQDIQKLMEAYESVVSEKAVSQQQQKLMGLALAYKRGEVSADKISPEAKAMADKMSEKDLEDFAKTKHKGLPVTKEEVELEEASGKDIAAKMMKSKSMKAFAPKVAKMANVSAGDLEKMLPDYVPGAEIRKLFEEALDEAAKMSAKSKEWAAKTKEWYEKGYAMGKNPDSYKSPPYGIGGAAMDAFRKGRKDGEAAAKKESGNEEVWKEIETYANKHGGIDKKDMLKVAMMLKKGDRKGAVKYARGLDTDPRDWLLDKMNEELQETSCGKDRMKKEAEEKDDDKKMDPVNKKALKKDFDDRDDKDIDNDGDVDDSDEYLHKRRKAVGKAMAKDKKDGKTAEISKIGEAFDEFWSALQEAANPKKGATPPEGLTDKESPKSKEFIAKHTVDLEDEEETHQTGTDAGRATKPAPARPGDNKAGDKKIINPVKGAVKEDTRTYQQKIMDILSGKTWGEIADNVEELKGEE